MRVLDIINIDNQNSNNIDNLKKMQMYFLTPTILCPQESLIQTEFEIIRDLKLKALYYKQLSLKYEEANVINNYQLKH